MDTELENESPLAIFFFDRAYEFSNLFDRTKKISHITMFFNDMNYALFCSRTPGLAGLVNYLRAHYLQDLPLPKELRSNEISAAYKLLGRRNKTLQLLGHEALLIGTFTYPKIRYFFLTTKPSFHPDHFILMHFDDATMISYSPLDILHGLIHGYPLVNSKYIYFVQFADEDNPDIQQVAKRIYNETINKPEYIQPVRQAPYPIAAQRTQSDLPHAPNPNLLQFPDIEDFPIDSLGMLRSNTQDNFRKQIAHWLASRKFAPDVRNSRQQTLWHVAAKRGDDIVS